MINHQDRLQDRQARDNNTNSMLLRQYSGQNNLSFNHRIQDMQ